MPRLRVLVGPTAEDLVPITDIVNTGQPYTIVSEHFEGKIAIYVKNFVDPNGRPLTSEYFEREDRKGVTWSIQVQGMCYSRCPCLVVSHRPLMCSHRPVLATTFSG